MTISQTILVGPQWEIDDAAGPAAMSAFINAIGGECTLPSDTIGVRFRFRQIKQKAKLPDGWSFVSEPGHLGVLNAIKIENISVPLEAEKLEVVVRLPSSL